MWAHVQKFTERKYLEKQNFFPKKRLANAKLLGETCITFPINPNRNLIKLKSEIKYIKKFLNKYI